MGLLGLGGFSLRCAFSTPPYQGPVSDHFDGKAFINPGPALQGGFLKWMLTREPGKWNDWTDAPFGPKPQERVSHGSLRVTLVNHSTVLLQLETLNILTDPIWSYRASPVGWAGPKRHRPPGIRFEDLPPIDVVLVSHNHYDHMDIATLQRLADEHRPRLYTTLGNRDFLQARGIPVAGEMDWWEGAPLAAGLSLSCVPAQHFSGRGICDRSTSLWAGFVIESTTGNIYFAGDTGMGPHFREIAARFAPLRLAMLPIGAFRPRWFMSPVHLAPDEAVATHHLVGATQSMPIHYGTFRLGDDGEAEPIEELEKAIVAANDPKLSFLIPVHGIALDIPVPVVGRD